MKLPGEYERFSALVDRVLSVPREELLRREAEYEKQANANPRKRGPKKKAVVKPPSPSRVPAS